MNKHVSVPLKPLSFDWKTPNYVDIFYERRDNLERIRRAGPKALADLKEYYRDDPNGPADFISDWGCAHEPRNLEIGLPAVIPMILFPKQRELIGYILRKWKARESGLIEKSRDIGATWISISLSCTLCLFHDYMTIGFGSRKAEYVDGVGTMKPILPKGRFFLSNLPPEFRGEWVQWRDAPHMRIGFPSTSSLISGEGGDDIGRGDRTSIYFWDETAHHPKQEVVEAALSQTSNCRMYMSSVRGSANLFAQKRWSGKVEVFIFDWRDDPRKDDAWYEKQCAELDAVVVAQEIDRDYNASVQGIVIPGEWVRAAIDAREKLGIAPAGAELVGFDVADEGQDKNAVARLKGIEILETDEWSGKGSDTFASAEYVFDQCDEWGVRSFRYDADGIGATVRGDARVINERRERKNQRRVSAIGYRGSEAVIDPEGIVEGTIGREGDKGRTNEDFFANRKAQEWWRLRLAFQRTWRWVVKGIACDPNTIISISSKDPSHQKLVAELSQATFKANDAGFIVINKTPKGQKSPNRADAVIIARAPRDVEATEVSASVLSKIRGMRRRVRVG